MTIGNRFEVFLQPFSEEIKNDYWCEFTCSKCKEKVVSTPKVQASLRYGGVGHKCNNCDTYLALICCPSCRATLTIDDEEWELLANLEGSNCPTCGAILFRTKLNSGPQMVSSGIMCPGLNVWSSSIIEKSYLTKIRKQFSDEKLTLFTIKHHSVGVRMKSSKCSLQYIEDNKWYSPLTISNVSSPIKESIEYKTPFDYDFHNNLFGFINNLRSALDIMSQEVGYIFNPEIPEKDIDFYKIDNLLKICEPALYGIIKAFRETETFIYLNKLRNVLQHRRIPLMVSVGAYDTSELDTLRPKNVRSLATIQLPNDPYACDDIKKNNSYNIMLFPKISEMYKETEEFILNIYKTINP